MIIQLESGVPHVQTSIYEANEGATVLVANRISIAIHRYLKTTTIIPWPHPSGLTKMIQEIGESCSVITDLDDV